MGSGYPCVLAEPVCEAAFRLTPREQIRLARLCRRLANDPFCSGDYETRDRAGRTLQNLLLDDWVITFWTDHAAMEVRIIEAARV